MTEYVIAICTYRRPQLLPQTLSSLAQLDRPDAEWQVVVVDNDCDDAIRNIVNNFAGQLPIRYEQEPQIGIARARNRAVHVTEAPIIVFADDDVVFDPKWLCSMVNAVRSQPQCVFWGGRIIPTWPMNRPDWFDVDRCPTLGDSIVRYDLGSGSRIWRYEEDPEFYTCNLALRTESVRQAGGFDVTLGHRGSDRGGGEDSWMIKSLSQRGGQGWYAADAVLRHPVTADRLTRAHAQAFAWWQGRLGVLMLQRKKSDDQHRQGKTPRWLYRIAFTELLTGLRQWFVGTVSRDPGLAFTGQFTMLFNLSKLWHATLGKAVGRKASS